MFASIRLCLLKYFNWKGKKKISFFQFVTCNCPAGTWPVVVVLHYIQYTSRTTDLSAAFKDTYTSLQCWKGCHRTAAGLALWSCCCLQYRFPKKLTILFHTTKLVIHPCKYNCWLLRCSIYLPGNYFLENSRCAISSQNSNCFHSMMETCVLYDLYRHTFCSRLLNCVIQGWK